MTAHFLSSALGSTVISAPSTGTVWEILGCVAAAGAVGGLVNALIGGSGGNGRLVLPKVVQPANVFQLGFLGNIILGAFAAAITWGLYGPLKDAVMLGASPGNGLPANLTVTALLGASLVGAGGAKVITSELDKSILQKTAVQAAQQPQSANLAAQIAIARPIEALAAATPEPQATATGPQTTATDPQATATDPQAPVTV
jgi:hypothetical protein